MLENRSTITVYAGRTSRPAKSKKPPQNWRILDFYGTILG